LAHRFTSCYCWQSENPADVFYFIALEGALKLKEIFYIYAKTYSAGVVVAV
jgi:hypothetical protein